MSITDSGMYCHSLTNPARIRAKGVSLHDYMRSFTDSRLMLGLLYVAPHSLRAELRILIVHATCLRLRLDASQTTHAAGQWTQVPKINRMLLS